MNGPAMLRFTNAAANKYRPPRPVPFPQAPLGGVPSDLGDAAMIAFHSFVENRVGVGRPRCPGTKEKGDAPSRRGPSTRRSSELPPTTSRHHKSRRGFPRVLRPARVFSSHLIDPDRHESDDRWLTTSSPYYRFTGTSQNPHLSRRPRRADSTTENFPHVMFAAPEATLVSYTCR